MTEAERIEKAGEEYIRSIGEDPSIMYSGDVHLAGEAFIAGQKAERIENSDKYIPTNETDPNITMASLRKKLTEAHKENERLQRQLKQKKAEKLLFDRIKETEINVLKEELKSAQDMNRDLIQKLVAVIEGYTTMDIVKIKHDYPYYEAEHEYIRSLIQESKKHTSSE